MKHSMIKALAGTLLILAGCSQAELDIVPGAGGLRITVDSGEIGTRATETDDEVAGAGRENLIKTIDYFLFAGDGSGRYLYKGHVDPAVEATTYTIYDAAAITGLGSGTYKVFVIVNYPGATADLGENGSPSSDSDKRTMVELNQILLRESEHQTFLGSADDIPEPAGDDKLFLVMTGVNDSFSFDASNAVNEVTVPLYRLAAKVTMEFYVKDTVTPESSDGVTETWTPMTDGTNVRVYLCRGARTIRLDGGIPAAEELAAEETTLFDYKSGPYCSAMASSKDDYSHAFASDAFYTYPRTWDEGDADEPYLKLIIPWKVKRLAAEVASEYQKEFYYKVMLPSSLTGDGNGFKSNHWYRLLVDVDRVGSITEDAAVELTCHYEVADWNNKAVTSSLVQGYFLDVNRGQPTLTVYAANTVEIPYTASGPVVLRVKYPTRTDSNNDGIIDINDAPAANTPEATNQQVDAVYYLFNRAKQALNSSEQQIGSHKVYLPSENGGYSISLRESDHHIVITHELKDNYAANNPTYDVSPFEFTFTLGLEDDPTNPNNLYDRTVTVIQYPPLYIQQELGGSVFVKGTSAPSSGQTQVYSNNSSSLNDTSAPYYMGSVTNEASIQGRVSTSATPIHNDSPYMVEVSASILKNYQFYLGGILLAAVIDDPRVAAGSNPFQLGLSGLEDSKYRPTAEGKENMIAPRFRVASSYGKTRATSYEGAVRRCAAYQEAGYPAGRWRLPTAAEVAFLIKLSDDGYILSLFDPEDLYKYDNPNRGTNSYLGRDWVNLNDGYWSGGKWGRFLARGTQSEFTSYWADVNNTNVFRSMSGYSYNVPNFMRNNSTYESTATVIYDYYWNHSSSDSAPRSFHLYARCIYDSWYWDESENPKSTDGFAYMP